MSSGYPAVVLAIAVISVLTSSVPPARCYKVTSLAALPTLGRLDLGGAVGPKSLAFDGLGGGPYTGVTGGSILVWGGDGSGWARYAVNSPDRSKECDSVGGGIIDPPEYECGRPLGLQFHEASGVLYVADAYLGLLAVDPGGGEARVLAAAADDGEAFGFADGLDVDQRTGDVYFTDTSTRFERWEYFLVMLTGDSTGRLIKYDPRTARATVMERGLQFPNGVALSEDGSFLLFAETGLHRIMRRWLRGPREGSMEVFADVPGYPENIRRAPNGEYWVGINRERIGSQSKDWAENLVAVRLSGAGEVVEALDGRRWASVSEVVEREGVLWIGSVDVPYVEAFER